MIEPCADLSSNNTFDRTAGSHSLAPRPVNVSVDMTSTVKCHAHESRAADGRPSLHAACAAPMRPSSATRSKCDRTVASGSTIRSGAAMSVPPPGSGQLEPPAETEPVTATVDHADIRGLGTTLLVSVAAPASL